MKLLDTSAWVEYFQGSEKGKKVRNFLVEPEIYTSAMTLAEISRWFTENNISVDMGITQIKTNSIIIDVEERVLVESGRKYVALRKIKPKIGLIDAIIYVTAVQHNLTLITGDFDFKGLPDVEII